MISAAFKATNLGATVPVLVLVNGINVMDSPTVLTVPMSRDVVKTLTFLYETSRLVTNFLQKELAEIAHRTSSSAP